LALAACRLGGSGVVGRSGPNVMLRLVGEEVLRIKGVTILVYNYSQLTEYDLLKLQTSRPVDNCLVHSLDVDSAIFGVLKGLD